MLNKQHFFKLVLAGIMVALTFVIAGCWDRKEIENHGFVLGIAIDYVETPEPKGQYDLTHVTQETGGRKYRVTYELPRISKGGEGKEGAKDKNHLLFVGEGESMFAIVRAMAAKTYTKLFFEDIQILVFSEAVAKDGIGDILDFYMRDHEMRRRVKVLVSPGRAEDILKSKIQTEDVNSSFIAKTTKNVKNIPRFASKADLGDVSEAIRNNRSFFVPMVEIENEDVKLTKAASFNKEKKMVGVIDEWEIIGGKILRKNLNQGVYTVKNPANPDKLVAFELRESKIEVNSHLNGEKLWFTLEAKFIGNLGENMQTGQKALDPVFLAAVEQELTAEFTRQVQARYDKSQELKTEPLGLGGTVRRQHPEYWEKVKEHWDDEVFPTVPLEVDIKVIIRITGMTT